MKKLLTVAGLMLAMSLAIPASSYANAQHGCWQHRHHGMQHMAQQLNLSDKQKDQFKQLHRKSRDRMQTIRDAMKDNREALMKLDPQDRDYMSKVDKLATEKGRLVERSVKQFAKMRADFYAILTPEQRSKLAEMRKQHQGRRGHCGGMHGERGMDRGPGGAPGGGMGPGPRGMGM